VRKGGFEKPLQRILNDLQGLGRSVSSLRQYKARVTDCKRTVDFTTARAVRHPCPVALDSRFRAPCGKEYRRVMRQTERPTTRPKIVLRGFWSNATGAASSSILPFSTSSVAEVDSWRTKDEDDRLKVVTQRNRCVRFHSPVPQNG
jgi:hypothetical protein